jgi:hypothetical protein
MSSGSESFIAENFVTAYMLCNLARYTYVLVYIYIYIESIYPTPPPPHGYTAGGQILIAEEFLATIIRHNNSITLHSLPQYLYVCTNL